MLFLVGLNAATALGRYLFGIGLTWSDELLQFTLIWGISLGVFLVSLRNGHLTMDLALTRLPARAARAIEALITLVSMAILVYVIAQSWRFIGQIATVEQKSMAMQVPMAYPHSALPVGFALMVVALAARAWRASANRRLR
jgi:TRAP-type C4-dicarboxylate transport system permease small subunit